MLDLDNQLCANKKGLIKNFNTTLILTNKHYLVSFADEIKIIRTALAMTNLEKIIEENKEKIFSYARSLEIVIEVL